MSLSIVTCGPSISGTPGDAHIASPLRAASADVLNGAVAGAVSEWIVFADSVADVGVDAESLAGADADGVLIMGSGDGLEFGDGAWMRLFDPVDGGVMIAAIRRSQAGATPFADVERPVQEWFVRQLVSGKPIEVREQTSVADCAADASVLPTLRPSEPESHTSWVVDAVEQLPLGTVPGGIGSGPDVAALKAGLLQVNDFLDASHEYSQSVQGRGANSAGDYWHAIMHRREPDYSNAKYWFRAVGSHPIFAELAAHAERLLTCQPSIAELWGPRLMSGRTWDPFAFVDLCAECPRAENDELSLFARELQWIEMQLLLKQTFVDASGCG